MGRYWDNPKAELFQYLGLGSIIYILILSTFLWLLIILLGPKEWSYWKFLTFVSLTSPPAILYAIPVERFLNIRLANDINAWFLAIVAVWRVALLIFYLLRVSQLSISRAIVGTFFPLSIIVVVLTMLNLERAVFNVMGGIHENSPNDGAYMVLVLLSMLSVLLFLPLLIWYLALVATAPKPKSDNSIFIQEADN
jgi:hypothetical protein